MQGRILTKSALKDLTTVYYSVDRLIALDMCLGIDVLVPVDLAEC